MPGAANGRQTEFVETPTRLVTTEDGRHVKESCTRNPNFNMGKERCGPILRNPGGSKETRDEFMSVPDLSVVRFGVFPKDENIDWTKPE